MIYLDEGNNEWITVGSPQEIKENIQQKPPQVKRVVRKVVVPQQQPTKVKQPEPRKPRLDEVKPEPLKGNLSGNFSRRINDEHRIIYRVEGEIIYIKSCRWHYSKK